jgi:hypothetical protein
MSGLLRGTAEKTYEEQYTLSVAYLCLPDGITASQHGVLRAFLK